MEQFTVYELLLSKEEMASKYFWSLTTGKVTWLQAIFPPTFHQSQISEFSR